MYLYLFDTSRNDFLDPNTLGWSFKAIMNQIYPNIIVVRGTTCSASVDINTPTKTNKVLLKEYDIVDYSESNNPDNLEEGTVHWSEEYNAFVIRNKQTSNSTLLFKAKLLIYKNSSLRK